MTLIEILVAIVVLSIGLLGLAGLQLRGIQVNQGSIYRWQAAELTEDIADRMRSDSTSAKNNAYAMNGVAPTGGSSGTQAAIADWWNRVQTQLPGGSAVIAPFVPDAAPSTGGSITVTVSWVDTRAQAGAGVSSVNNPTVYNTPGSYTVTLEF